MEKLNQTTQLLIKESGRIPDERKLRLEELAIYIKGKLDSGKEVHLVFICTHNSRRSHMAQIWAKAAAHYFGIGHINTYSGGTQKTAFHPSAVRALKEAGFKIKKSGGKSNPKYKVKYASDIKSLLCFSKKYQHKSIPKEGFAAIMTCSDADEACPVVEGAEYRTSITYDDPKIYDGTVKEAEAYIERSLQIGREMLYVFAKVTKMLR